MLALRMHIMHPAVAGLTVGITGAAHNNWRPPVPAGVIGADPFSGRSQPGSDCPMGCTHKCR